MDYRIEQDTLGKVKVPIDVYWGAQTERSRDNFKIGVERFQWGRAVKRALGILKKAAAIEEFSEEITSKVFAQRTLCEPALKLLDQKLKAMIFFQKNVAKSYKR